MSKPAKTADELIALAIKELRSRVDCPAGIRVAIVPENGSWKFRVTGSESTIAEFGYQKCVEILSEVGDILAKDYDVAV